MLNKASLSVECSSMVGRLFTCIKSFTWVNNLRPNAPAGCDKAKSSEVKCLLCTNATANASPSAKVAVVLDVGAKPRGQASSDAPKVKATSADLGKIPRLSRLILMSGMPSFFTTGSNVRISSDSPEFEMPINTSPLTNIPRSP